MKNDAYFSKTVDERELQAISTLLIAFVCVWFVYSFGKGNGTVAGFCFSLDKFCLLSYNSLI